MRRLGAALSVLAVAAIASAGEIAPSERRSGYDFMSRETRAMQDDDTANPGMLWVLEGGTLWEKKTGAAGRACADCHGDPRASMKGVAARYPAFDAGKGRPVGLEQRINVCRTDRQEAPALAYESRELLALTALVARPADRHRDRRADAAVPRRRPRDVPPAPGPAQPRVRAMPRRQLGTAARGQRHSAGASDRVSALPPREAEPRLAPASAAHLSRRHPRGAVRLWCPRARRSRELPDVARARNDDGRAGRPALMTRV